MAYNFHQPIRYYKANDPYFYEVDNIPLRQLEENILFIKNKLEGNTGEGGSVYLNEASELNLNMVKQLRPKMIAGRTIQVNAGKFTSRVNDAYNIGTALASLVYDSIGPGGSEPVLIPDLRDSWTETQRNTVWTAFTTNGGTAYNVNGLEIAYTFYSSPGGFGSNWGTVANTNAAPAEGSENYPQYDKDTTSHRWPGHNTYGPLTAAQIGPMLGYDNQYTYSNLPSIHLSFVKKWRGVFRTAVVDFPQSTIDIPSFSEWDYYYEGAGGTRVPIEGANQRIDLLVAYSLPIDSSGTTLQNYEEEFCQIGGNPSPKTITTPILGLIRGAGVGIRKDESTPLPSIATEEGCDDKGTPGIARMVGNINDTATTANVGISTEGSDPQVIHGSFPSPDDLLNIAPLLAMDVDGDNLQLVGQAALPLAYVVVREGQEIITQDDIIDIRPFLRTTEFTYNERAGVAGANPPLSLANPAVGMFQLQDVSKKMYSNLYGAIPTTEELRDGQALYTDYVMGGLAYGPEGVMLTMNENSSHQNDPWGSTTQTASLTYGGITYTFEEFVSNKAFMEWAAVNKKEALLQYFYNSRQADLKVWLSDPNSSYNTANGTYLGLPGGTQGRNIPLYPEWDQPFNNSNQQAAIMTGSEKSAKCTWWMYIEGWGGQRNLAYTPGGIASTESTSEDSWLDVSFNPGWGPSSDRNGMIVTSSKRIEIKLPSWAMDYDVITEYVNCGPVTSTQNPNAIGDSDGKGLGSGLYVNKGPVVGSSSERAAIFYINSSAQPLPESDKGAICDGKVTDAEASNNGVCDGTRNSAPGPDRPYDWLSYTVCLPQFRSTQWGTNRQTEPFNNNTRFVPKLGMAFYPTVKFTVIAYRTLSSSKNSNLTSANNFTLIETNGNAGDLLSQTAPLYNNTVIDLSQ